MCDLFGDLVLSGDSESSKLFIAENVFNNTIKQQLHGILNTVYDHTRVDSDVIEEL